MKTVRDILEACGGSLEVAYRLSLHQATVEAWERGGVPEKHWTGLMQLDRSGGLSPAVIHLVNEEVRSSNRTPSSTEG